VRRLAVLAAVGLALAGCADDAGDEGERSPSIDPTATASPIRVEAPEGFRVVEEGPGDAQPCWGDDECSNNGPLVVLAPEADTTDPETVTSVTVTGFEGNQGGLQQASNNYLAAESEELEVDGRSALYSEDDGDGPGRALNELLVVRGDDAALSITSPELG
jgi:hypothetical protein